MLGKAHVIRMVMRDEDCVISRSSLEQPLYFRHGNVRPLFVHIRACIQDDARGFRFDFNDGAAYLSLAPEDVNS